MPLLLWGGSCEALPGGSFVRVGLMLIVEYCWNVFPSTHSSSLVLLAAHLVILAAMWSSKQPPATNKGAALENYKYHRRTSRRVRVRKSD